MAIYYPGRCSLSMGESVWHTQQQWSILSNDQDHVAGTVPVIELRSLAQATMSRAFFQAGKVPIPYGSCTRGHDSTGSYVWSGKNDRHSFGLMSRPTFLRICCARSLNTISVKPSSGDGDLARSTKGKSATRPTAVPSGFLNQ